MSAGCPRAAGTRPSVVLVDDQPVVLAGMRTWFRRAGIAVLAAGTDPGVALRAPGAAADVVVLDPHPAVGSGPAQAALDRLVAGGRRLVVHTVHDDGTAVARCCPVPGSGVVTKADGEAHLVDAVLAAAGAPVGPRPSTVRPRLTTRERDVLVAWLRSGSKRTAAALCHLSPRTVEGYIDRVRLRYAQVGRPAPTKVGLVVRALQDGLVALDDLDVADHPA